MRFLSFGLGFLLLSAVIFICLLNLGFHFFSEEEFVDDQRYVPWEIIDSRIRDKLAVCSNDFEKVSLIREFAYRHSDWSKVDHVNFTDSSVSSIYNYYENDVGGGQCGLAGIYLMKLFEHYGYESCTYDMGQAATHATHVSVIVRITNDQNTLYSIQDPTFNFTVVDSVNQPVDFSKVLTELSQKEISFRISEGNYSGYTEYLTDHRVVFKTKWNYVQNFTKICLSNGENFKYSLKTKRTMRRFLENHGKEYMRILSTRGLPLDIRYLYLLPIHESDCSSSVIQDKIDMMKPNSVRKI